MTVCYYYLCSWVSVYFFNILIYLFYVLWVWLGSPHPPPTYLSALRQLLLILYAFKFGKFYLLFFNIFFYVILFYLFIYLFCVFFFCLIFFYRVEFFVFFEIFVEFTGFDFSLYNRHAAAASRLLRTKWTLRVIRLRSAFFSLLSLSSIDLSFFMQVSLSFFLFYLYLSFL
jgi:hypothetical protein